MGRADGGEEESGGPMLSPSAQAVALVVDSEVTSYLMMGALSPLLKRHAVSLFEGGRITGTEVSARIEPTKDVRMFAAA